VPFIQIIEFTTSKIDDFPAVLDEWLAQTEGQRAASRGTLTRVRDRANTYLQIVEFPSYEEAMTNSDLPATTEFAARLAEQSDGPPTFRNDAVGSNFLSSAEVDRTCQGGAGAADVSGVGNPGT
jgi:hypothetical protein